MGLFKKLASAFGWLKHEVRILVIGLDNSGKTTLVNIIKPKKVCVRAPRRARARAPRARVNRCGRARARRRPRAKLRRLSVSKWRSSAKTT